MNVHEMRSRLGVTQSEFAARYHIPFRTVQNWEAGMRKPPEYMVRLLEDRVRDDLVNRKTAFLPKRSLRKNDLPKRGDYLGAASWLRAVRASMEEDVVFALEDALMCQGSFLGHNYEPFVWVYGSDSLSRFNGVVVLGNRISPYNVREHNGLVYTDFNRTLADFLANEAILDMQGITEALSRYYFCHGESFEGVSVPPEYQERFEELAKDAIEYYTS